MRARWLVVAAGAALLPSGAGAQRTVTVRADNDAFNFWQFPWARPDEEYTSGVRLVIEEPGAAAWARRLPRALGGCGATSRCTSHAWTLGQDIFTAVRPRGSDTPKPGGRPDAGVLWISGTSAIARDADRTDIGWTLGVTGKPSLAESMQRFFHQLAPVYNRPIAWAHEVPAEPVLALSLDRRRLRTLPMGSSDSSGALELQPHAGASFGNLLTELRAGVGARLGRSLPHPWKESAGPKLPAFSLEGDAMLRAVARNEVLNGALFRRSAHVTARPFVTEVQFGVRVRWRAFEAAWIAHQTSAEYVSRGAPHTWSTLEAVWRPR